VEGETEFAFCRYLKTRFSQGQHLQVSIKSAQGGSPDTIVEYARRQMRQFPHDHLAIVFDTDCELSPKGEKTLRTIKAETFRFTPCIEGFFLELMGRSVPTDTESCKRKFHEHGLDEKAKLSHEAYERLFPSDRIEACSRHPDFSRLKRLFSNQGGVE
jgi:hypothetical protein